MHQSRRHFLLSASTLASPTIVLKAQAQPAAWPKEPIRIVVTQGAGSGSDVVARLLASQMQISMKHPVVVDNRPGAAGSIGHEFVAKSVPDGYTLLLTSTGPLLVVPEMMAAARFRYKDFAPIASVNSASFVVLVADTPTGPRTLQELRSRIASTPSTFGSSGAGTMAHLASSLILKQAGLKAEHIPYKANAQVLQDLVGGQLTFACDSVASARPLLQAGRVRALAVTGAERMPSLPQVPTLQEAGLAGVTATTISGLLAPAGTSRAILARLATEVETALATSQMSERLAALESPPLYYGSAAYARQLDADARLWGDLVKQLNLRTE